MATTEEIERRVEEADTARSATRATVAKRVGELAKRQAAVAEQLRGLEHELGDVLAKSSDVIDIDELARFTDVPVADLKRWLIDRKITRPKRKRAVVGTGSTSQVTSKPPSVSPPSTS